MGSNRQWRRPIVVVPVAVVTSIALVIALAAFQPWRLFIDVTVNEELPTASSAQVGESDSSIDVNQPTAQPETTDGLNDAETQTKAEVEAEAESLTSPTPTSTASEQPTPQRTITAEGSFISHEHPTAGIARIITLEDGSRVLRLVGLDTDNGPDLKVWLAAAPVIEGRDGWFVFDDDEYLSLGPLKGNKGNQNYPIPADADISDLTSVTIWCERFSVSFGAAELMTV